jgi:hypothetical protein
MTVSGNTNGKHVIWRHRRSEYIDTSMRFLHLLFLSLLVSSIHTLPCSLYLAPSSIPEEGLGVYTTRDFGIGERIVRAL